MSNANSKDNSPGRSVTSRDQLLTIGDLELFKNDLLIEIRNVLKESKGQITKQWLRSFEVRKMLGVSPGTLQNLRINGSLPYTKVGGIVFYKYEDIVCLLESNRIGRSVTNG
ncbi:MAG: helix-turn-helix domain-containing protein [Cyclobacteriaceae bacterium]|nr:helix-turn-helix domain-containing protein [Cyclobacteriaceae bacterium]